MGFPSCGSSCQVIGRPFRIDTAKRRRQRQRDDRHRSRRSVPRSLGRSLGARIRASILLADLHDTLAAARRAQGWPQRGRAHCVPKRFAEWAASPRLDTCLPALRMPTFRRSRRRRVGHMSGKRAPGLSRAVGSARSLRMASMAGAGAGQVVNGGSAWSGATPVTQHSPGSRARRRPLQGGRSGSPVVRMAAGLVSFVDIVRV
jgi:hypothetical protein